MQSSTDTLNSAARLVTWINDLKREHRTFVNVYQAALNLAYEVLGCNCPLERLNLYAHRCKHVTASAAIWKQLIREGMLRKLTKFDDDENPVPAGTEIGRVPALSSKILGLLEEATTTTKATRPSRSPLHNHYDEVRLMLKTHTVAEVARHYGVDYSSVRYFIRHHCD